MRNAASAVHALPTLPASRPGQARTSSSNEAASGTRTRRTQIAPLAPQAASKLIAGAGIEYLHAEAVADVDWRAFAGVRRAVTAIVGSKQPRAGLVEVP